MNLWLCLILTLAHLLLRDASLDARVDQGEQSFGQVAHFVPICMVTVREFIVHCCLILLFFAGGQLYFGSDLLTPGLRRWLSLFGCTHCC